MLHSETYPKLEMPIGLFIMMITILLLHQRSCRAITSLNNENIVDDSIQLDKIENGFVTTIINQD